MLKSFLSDIYNLFVSFYLALAYSFCKPLDYRSSEESSFGFLYYNTFSSQLSYEASLFQNLSPSDTFILSPNPKRLGHVYTISQLNRLYSFKKKILFFYRDQFITFGSICSALLSYFYIPFLCKISSYKFTRSDSYKRRVRCFATRNYVDFLNKHFYLNKDLAYILTENQPQEQFLFKYFFKIFSFMPSGVLYYYFTPLLSSSIIPSRLDLSSNLAPKHYFVIGRYASVYFSTIFPSSCSFSPLFLSRVSFPTIASKCVSCDPKTCLVILVLLPYSIFYSRQLLSLLDTLTCNVKFFVKIHPSIPIHSRNDFFLPSNSRFLLDKKSIMEEINSESYDAIISIISSSALELLPLDLEIAYCNYLNTSTLPFNHLDHCFSCISTFSNAAELAQWISSLTHKSQLRYSNDKSRVNLFHYLYNTKS